MAISKAKAIAAINKKGILLVYPLQNKKEPDSLWSELFPRTKMRWEWDAGGDTRVSDLWQLRTLLSISRDVVYLKWFQGRATFFSKEVFVWMLAYQRTEFKLSPEASRIFEALEMDSPLGTKQVKEAADLRGRLFEASFNRAMKILWNRLWIVGYGEVDDSSFPSLAVGASRLLFEDLWEESLTISSDQAGKLLSAKLGSENPFWKFAVKTRGLSAAAESGLDQAGRKKRRK